MNPLDLRLSVSSDLTAPIGWTDLVLAFELHNTSPSPVDVYPTMAQFMPASGWLSPAWDILFESPQFTPRLRELRTYFGPPGMPPGKQVFEQRRESLAPGKSWRAQLNMCFIPRSELPDAEVSRATLDPHGMDGVTDDELRDRSVIVLHATAAELRKRPPGELLKHGFANRIVFVPTHGTLDVFMRYRQEAWSGFFDPKLKVVVESNRLTLRIG